MQNVSEILVSDGSSRSISENAKASILARLPQGLSEKLNYFSANDLPFLQRLGMLASEASEGAILFAGDEDFPDFYHLDTHLKLLDNDINLHTIAGRYVNITVNQESKRIGFTSNERPYYDLLINHPSPIVRLVQYFTLDALGTASLYYGILRRERFVEFYRSLSRENYYYGGVEHMQKYQSLCEGSVYLSPHPAIIRDQLYHNYVVEQLREAPNSDEYPYHGNKAVMRCADILGLATNLSITDAISFVSYQLKSSASLMKSRNGVQNVLGHRLVHETSGLTNAAVSRAFNETFSDIYR